MEINNHPDYLIYKDGKVFSKKRNKFLKQTIDSLGYCRINLCKNGKIKNIHIHRLVAEHYIPNPENKRCVDHIDRIRDHNNLNNLRWATHIENNNNRTIINKTRINNKTGYSNISFSKRDNVFRFHKLIKNKVYQKYFKTLKEALCYKYIFLLKIKTNII